MYFGILTGIVVTRGNPKNLLVNLLNIEQTTTTFKSYLCFSSLKENLFLVSYYYGGAYMHICEQKICSLKEDLKSISVKSYCDSNYYK